LLFTEFANKLPNPDDFLDAFFSQMQFSTGEWTYYTQAYDAFGIATCVFVIQPAQVIATGMMIRMSYSILDFASDDSVTFFEVLEHLNQMF
jgi:hypothetical protein